jgi:hypothetical protein
MIHDDDNNYDTDVAVLPHDPSYIFDEMFGRLGLSDESNGLVSYKIDALLLDIQLCYCQFNSILMTINFQYFY